MEKSDQRMMSWIKYQEDLKTVIDTGSCEKICYCNCHLEHMEQYCPFCMDAYDKANPDECECVRDRIILCKRHEEIMDKVAIYRIL